MRAAKVHISIRIRGTGRKSRYRYIHRHSSVLSQCLHIVTTMKGHFFFFFFCGEGAPQLMLRTHRSLKAYCVTPVMKMKMRMSSFLPSFTSNGAPVE
jgi:hypothetical protein